MSVAPRTRTTRINEIIERYGRNPTANELRAIKNLPLGGKADLWDTSATGRKIWDLLEESERLHDVSLLDEAGCLLWLQITDYDIRAEVDRSAYVKWLTTPLKLKPGYMYTPMSHSVGASSSSGALKRDGTRVEVNPTAPASSSASASSFIASQDPITVALGIYHQPQDSTNSDPSALPTHYRPSDTPRFSQPNISRSTDHALPTLHTFYPGNTTGPHQHSNMTGADDSLLPNNVPATPAPTLPKKT